MQRLKVQVLSELEPWLRGWDTRMVISGDSYLSFMEGFPERLRYCIIPSGEVLCPVPYESPRLGLTERIGGAYHFRLDPNDPKPLNRDDYHFVPTKRDPGLVWVEGPFCTPDQHWAEFEDVERVLDFEIP